MQPFERFLLEQDGALQKLSRLSRGRYTVDELRSESWIVLCEVEALREEPLELANPREQLLLVECLKRHIARAHRGSFGTLSLDYGGDSRSDKPALLWFLAAPENSDPLVQLQESGEQIDWIALARATYSQIAAYLLLFVRFDWDRVKVADCLHISVVLLRCRLMAAGNQARHQPSLFDGVDCIAQDFIPLPSRSRLSPAEIGPAPEQMILLLCPASATEERSDYL